MDLKAAVAYVEKELVVTSKALHQLKERMKIKTFRDSESNRNDLATLEERLELFNFVLPKLREELNKEAPPPTVTKKKDVPSTPTTMSFGLDLSPVTEED